MKPYIRDGPKLTDGAGLSRCSHTTFKVKTEDRYNIPYVDHAFSCFHATAWVISVYQYAKYSQNAPLCCFGFIGFPVTEAPAIEFFFALGFDVLFWSFPPIVFPTMWTWRQWSGRWGRITSDTNLFFSSEYELKLSMNIVIQVHSNGEDKANQRCGTDSVPGVSLRWPSGFAETIQLD